MFKLDRQDSGSRVCDAVPPDFEVSEFRADVFNLKASICYFSDQLSNVTAPTLLDTVLCILCVLPYLLY